MLPNFSYIRPGSLEEALRLLTLDGARIHAGGTDLLGCLRDRVFGCSTVVSLNQVKELRGIRENSDGVPRIGALTLLSEVEAHPLVRAKYRALAMAAAEVGTPQLRHQGTIGGNLCQKPRCWYYRGEFHCLRKGGEQCFAEGGENQYHCLFGGENCFMVHPSDTAAALVALKASVRLLGPRGARTVAMADFFVSPAKDYTRETILEPGEILTEVVLPSPDEGLKSAYRKVRARRSWDFALAGAALAVRLEGGKVDRCRVVFSGVAPIPWRAGAVEAAIQGRPLNRETVAQAMDAAVKDAKPMAKNGYKVTLLRGIIEEELMALA